MQNSRTESRFSWGFLIVGALFIIAAFIAFLNPAANLHTFTIFYAVLAIVNGVWLIMSRGSSGLRVVAGIFNILLGIYMLMNIYLAMTALAYVFAIWFIVDSALRLLALGDVRRESGTGMMVFSLIVNIIGLIVGFMLLFQPALSLLTLSFLVGFYLMVIGVSFVIAAFGGSAAASTVDEGYVVNSTDDTRDQY